MAEIISAAFTGKENAARLQAYIDTHSVTEITEPGVYDLGDTVYLDDDKTLIFGEGVVIRRVNCERFNGNAFINRGAFTAKVNRNITVKGLKLLTDGVESTHASEECDKTIVGLRGHLAFFYVENLTLENIEITGLEKKDYGIQICNFRNVTVDGLFIEGKKDGIHFGPGSGFVLRNGTFRTADDPIALNADDYAVSNPTLGIIENGLIENCTDLYEDINDGFFIRILSGAWGDWYSGMKVRHSDSVVYNGSVYRVVMQPSWDEFVSVTPPDFDSGFRTLDGIRWAKTDKEAVYHSLVRNITVRNIKLEKSRHTGICFSLEQNEYRRGLYGDAELLPNGNFVFENITAAADVEYPVAVLTPTDSIEIRNSHFGAGRLLISSGNQAGLACPPVKVTLDGNDFSYADIIHPDREFIPATE